jgi:hypothetical protein
VHAVRPPGDDLKIMPKRTWTDEQLREAVATARSLRGVEKALGYRTGAGRRSSQIVERIEALGLVTSFTASKSSAFPWSVD